MKRLAAFIMIALALSGVFVVPSVRAQDQPMTESHIERIKANCVEAQTQLTRIHTNDALLRVNRGQLYERILTKLMSPFNSRVALNNLNGATLVSISATYEQQLAEFRTYYREYDESMTALLKMNCMNQPVSFYDSVATARTKRQKVHDSTSKLQQSIQNYKKEFDAFAATQGGTQ